MTAPAMFLPTTREEMNARGWSECDVILVTGDAYVDHPHFGVAVIGRALEAQGYRVGVISQPEWHNTQDFMALGRPRLFFGVTSGNMESTLARLTVNRKVRSRDAYSAGGKVDLRPKRAAIVYSNQVRQAYGDVVIVLGGVECSLRRLAHYDFWSDCVRRSIIVDAKADILVYGMGEYTVLEVARQLAAGKKPREMLDIPGTAVCVRPGGEPQGTIIMPGFSDVIADKRAFNEAFRVFYENNNPTTGKPIAQKTGPQYVLHNPPPPPLTTEQLDWVYELPYQRAWHPKYNAAGGVPALDPVKFSVTSHRGCFGNCHFCSIATHQGCAVQSRSIQSIVREVEELVKHPDFRGTIVDVGGPTANMYGMACKSKEPCNKGTCLVPEVCPNLDADLSRHLAVLRAVREIPGVRRVFVSSGIRHDLCLQPGGEEYLQELCQFHIGGRLKVAPEHVNADVLRLMNKPDPKTYEAFSALFDTVQKRVNRDQFLVQYFMAAHPGCRHEHMLKLAEHLRDRYLHPEQAQDFYPTPLTVSACMFYTGYHPLTNEKVYITRRERERLMQRAMIHYWEPKNFKLVRETLRKVRRNDLVGYARKCLAPPDEDLADGVDSRGRGFRSPGRDARIVDDRRYAPRGYDRRMVSDDPAGSEFGEGPAEYESSGRSPRREYSGSRPRSGDRSYSGRRPFDRDRPRGPERTDGRERRFDRDRPRSPAIPDAQERRPDRDAEPAAPRERRYDPDAQPVEDREGRYDPDAQPIEGREHRYDPDAQPVEDGEGRYDPDAQPTENRERRYDPDAQPTENRDRRFDRDAQPTQARDRRFDRDAQPTQARDRRFDRDAQPTQGRDRRFDRGAVSNESRDRRFDRDRNSSSGDSRGRRFDRDRSGPTDTRARRPDAGSNYNASRGGGFNRDRDSGSTSSRPARSDRDSRSSDYRGRRPDREGGQRRRPY